MTFAAIIALLQPFLVPLISLLAGWLLPSPLQKAKNDIEKIHETEKKVSEGSAATSDLDKLP